MSERFCWIRGQRDGQPGIYIFDDYIIYNGAPARFFTYEDGHPEAEPGDLL